METITKGQKVRTVTGRIGVVIEVRGTMLFTTINCGSWVHVTKAFLV